MVKLIVAALIFLGLGIGGFSLYSNFQTKQVSQPATTVIPTTPVHSITPTVPTSVPQGGAKFYLQSF